MGLLLIHLGLSVFIFPTVIDLLAGWGLADKLSLGYRFFYAILGLTHHQPVIVLPFYLVAAGIDWKRDSIRSQKIRVLTLACGWLLLLSELYILGLTNRIHINLIQQIQ